MKITKKILEKIIKEELENITSEDKQQISEAPKKHFSYMIGRLDRIENLLKQLVAASQAGDLER